MMEMILTIIDGFIEHIGVILLGMGVAGYIIWVSAISDAQFRAEAREAKERADQERHTAVKTTLLKRLREAGSSGIYESVLTRGLETEERAVVERILLEMRDGEGLTASYDDAWKERHLIWNESSR